MISKESILQKIEKELQLAKTSTNEDRLLQHVQKIQALTELMLEANVNLHTQIEQQSMGVNQLHTSSVDDEDDKKDDGMSIFDF